MEVNELDIKVRRYTQTLSGRRLKNKYIVYDEDTERPLSGIAGQSRSTAYRIAKLLKTNKRRFR